MWEAIYFVSYSIRLTSQISSRTPMAPYRELNKYDAYDAGQVGGHVHHGCSYRIVRAVLAQAILPKIGLKCQPAKDGANHFYPNMASERLLALGSVPMLDFIGGQPASHSARSLLGVDAAAGKGG